MKVKFSRCTSSNLANVPQVDGQLIYTKDTNEVYLDVNNNRNKISDVIMVANKSTIVTPVTSKLYYETSTDTLYKAKIVENDNEEEIVWIDITGATVQYVDTNFLKKDNTTAYTPVGDYNPATKKYVDDNCIPYQPFPAGLDTSHTTLDFITSIRALNLPAGSTYLGGVTLTDMPFVGNAEVEIYVYPNNVIYLTLRSANISPYMWECNSHTYRGWEAVGKAYADSNFLKKDNTVAYTPTGDYNPTTKKYVDNVATEIEDIVEGLVNNQISEPTNGTNIDLQDSADSNIKSIEIYGNSEQETTTGKNKIGLANLEETSLNGLTFSIQGDIITINGSADDNTKISNVLFDIPIGSNSLNIIPISGEWESGAIGLRGRNAYGTQKWYSQITYSNIEQKITHDFTDEEINNTSIVELYCTASGVFNNYKFKIMMVAGDIVDKDFEKFTFGASPNPNYPQKINSSGDNGSITEKITNKNLFNKGNINSFNTYVGTVSHAISTNVNEKFRTIYVKLINGKTYTVSKGFGGSLILGTTEDVPTLGMTLNNFSNFSNLTDGKYGTITLSGNDKYLVAYIYSSADYDRGLDIQEIYDTLQIEENTVATTYLEHQEQIYTIPCQQPMRAIGDVKDTFVKIDGVWYERHNIIRKIYDGTEQFVSNLTDNGYYAYAENISNYLRVSGITCESNYFKATANGGFGTMQYAECHLRYSSNDNHKFFYMCTNISTVELFKEWLKEKYDNEMPVYVDYLLEEPIDLPCTQAQITALEALQKAKTYKNVTHIFSEDEVPAEVDLIYYLDNEIVYKNILLNYVKKTDYASSSVGGVVKAYSPNNFNVDNDGRPYTSNNTYATYLLKTDYSFIGKGTLETVINNSIILTGSTTPTTSTVGYRVGQLYLNTANNKVYQLTSIDDTDPNNIIYNWQQIINNTDLANTVGQINSVLDSINGVEV